MAYVIVLVLLAGVVVLLATPVLRRGAGESAEQSGTANRAADEVVDLEAARDAKYREIRDAELDHQTGKLSDADYELVDGALRAEAIEILRALDAARRRAARHAAAGE